MCFCNPTNRVENCGSPECQRLSNSLEIPAFLRRTPKEANMTDETRDELNLQENATDDTDPALPPEEEFTLEHALDAIRKLTAKIDELAEQRRLLKTQIKKMVDKL